MKASKLLISQLHQQIVYDWNKTDCDYSKEKIIHQLFEEQVKKTPNNIALVFEDQNITYSELNNRSNQLAYHIRLRYKQLNQTELEGGTLIALLLDRSIEMIVSILAVLKSGAAYVPILPEFPKQRIDYILKDTQVQILISQSHFKDELNKLDTNLNIIYADKDYSNYPIHNPTIQTNSRELAYVIYTSGTTGKPKGVMIEHQGIVNRIQWMQSIYHLTQKDRVLQKTPYNFDVSVWELLWANWYGATIVIAKPEGHKDCDYLYEEVINKKVTVIHFVPSMLDIFLEYISFNKKQLQELKTVFCSGEALKLNTVNKFYKLTKDQNTKLYNLYGPTEASIDVSFSICQSNKKVTIGKPIQNTRLYILDENLEPVPIGVEGELYIGGAGLARGYLNLPELTDKTFISNPFATEKDKKLGYTRLYMTGDLCKWLDNGEIEYIGRNDFQVKLRGHRVELGEIESVVSEINNIQQVCVITKQKPLRSQEQQTILVAYYISDDSIDNEFIKKYIKAKLPSYMLPNAFVKLDKFPLTISGKLDRKLLPEPRFSSQEYVAPITQTQQRLCDLWQNLLKVEKVGITDNFFELGGNSILAMEAIIRINELGYNYSVIDLLQAQNITNLLKTDANHIKNNLDTVHHFEKIILKHQLSSGNNLIYNESFVIKYKNKLNFSTFREAINKLLDKYEILHSSYILNNINGSLTRRLNYETPVICKFIQFASGESNLQSFLTQTDQTPFDIQNDKLIRFYLIELNDKRQYVFITFHHLMLDATSLINILLPDLYNFLFNKKSDLYSSPISNFYAAINAITQHYNYNNYGKINFWQDKINRNESLNLAFCKENKDSVQGKQLTKIFDRKIKFKISKIAKSLNFSEFNLLYGLFTFLIYKLSAQSQFMIMTNVDERIYVPDYNKVPGCLINNILLDVGITEDITLKQHIQNTKQTLIDNIKNAVAYETLIKLNRDKVKQLSDIQFNLETEEIDDYPYQQTQIYSHSGYVKKGIYFELDFKKDQILSRIEFNSSYYQQSLIQSLLSGYSNILETLETIIDKRISTIEILNSKQYKQIVYDWNKTDCDYSKEKTIHQLFEEQVIKTPDNIALMFQDKTLTYSELNKKANQLAHNIKATYQAINYTELMEDTLICLLLDRSIEMIVAILAVLKSGAAYVPISPEFPKQRIVSILQDTKAQILISQSHLQYKYDKLDANLNIIYADKVLDNYPITNLNTKVSAKNLAYVIYTSGTTGKPKGIMVEHCALVSFISLFKLKIISSNLTHFHLLSLTNYVFDIFGLEYALPLIYGDSIVLSSLEKVSDKELKQVNLIQQSPHTLLALCEKFDCQLKDKVALVGGEKATAKTIDKLLACFKHVYNMYGPAETVIWSSIHLFENSSQYACIGKPLYNEKLYILDKDLKPVLPGITGELYIGGNGLARGYLNLAELTQTKFISNPFTTEKDKKLGYTRLYKTGDLCKWLDNGEIEYIGRSDFQVKIRGFRIELGEVENSLVNIKGIKQACVIAKKNLNDQCYLVGYYVVEPTYQLTTKQIKETLTSSLAPYMVPTFFVELPQLPLTINGKLDRKRLPEPRVIHEQYISPKSSSQKALCKIWQKLLSVNNISLDDDFFNLGGNSLLAIKAAEEMSKVLNKTVNVADIFRLRTINHLISKLTVNFKLIKLLTPAVQDNRETIYFVHPAFAGCEVYQKLADKLSENYNCIGVDNYNLYKKLKISSLSHLAKLYIEELHLRSKSQNQNIILSGWSLGGLIAFEMAYWLEQYGIRNIQLILLDPHIPTGKPAKYHAHFNPDKGGRKVEEYIQELVKGLDDQYAQRVIKNKDIDITLGQTSPSGKLKHAKVFLFKALKQPGYFIKDNNLKKYVKYFDLYRINTDHINLMPQILKEWYKYQYSFLTKRFDWLTMKQDKSIYFIYKLKKTITYHKKLLLSISSGIIVASMYTLDIFDFIIEPLAVILTA